MTARAHRPLLIAVLLSGAVASAAPPVFGQSATEQARTYFNIGAQAYAKGDYAAAVEAFEEAYRRAPRPGILFSMAQAYRRKYYLDKQPPDLARAVDNYKKYIEREPSGSRRAEVAEALAELEPMLAKLQASGASMAPVAPKPATRVMISSPTPEATLSFDSGKPQGLPFIAEVKPGKHAFKVTAQGFIDAARDISVPEGGVLALDVPLEELRAHLTVRAPDGATVTIDGRPNGEMPLPPIELEPGRHFVVVTKNGKHAFSREIELGRGERRTLKADLESTGQRVASYVLFVGAGAAAITAGVFGYLAYNRQSDAKALLAQRDQQSLTKADLAAYEDDKSARDRFRAMGGASLAGAVALGATGLVLFAFDAPRVAPPPALPERKQPQPSPAAPSMEVSLAPFVGHRLGGAVIDGRF